MELINLNKDEILFKQGEPHKGVYIIINGKIQIETYQSYKDLIYIKFLLMHSLEFCPQFKKKKKKEGYGINFDKSWLIWGKYGAKRNKESDNLLRCNLLSLSKGVQDESRTHTPNRALPPQSSASTNSATWTKRERKTGLGPATPTLARSCSTN